MGTEQRLLLRDVIKKTLIDLADKGGAVNRDVIAEVRKKYPKLVKNTTRQLEDIALLRLLNGIAGKRTKLSAMAGEVDLFGEISGVPEFFSEKTENGDVKKVNFDGVKLQVLIDAYEQKSKPVDQDRNAIFAKVLSELRDRVGSGDFTLSEARNLL